MTTNAPAILEPWHDHTIASWPHVVVVGAGFGGLAAARELAEVRVRVTVIDRQNHHLFQPLLYQVATTTLDAADIAHPIRGVLRNQRNCRVLLAEVSDIDPGHRCVVTDVGALDFDYLIVATGATHSYFGHDEWADHAPGLKSLDDALAIRRRILTALERAEATADDERRRRHMTFVIVGGGPTGVELAGAVKEVATGALRDDFANIDTADSRVVLVEAGNRLLPAFPASLSASAARQLERIGVEIQTDNAVTNVDSTGVDTNRGRLDSATVLWAAGVAASPLGRHLSDDVDRAGCVRVTRELLLPDNDRVYVIGDLAAIENTGGKRIPGVAPAAQQAGRYAARSIQARLAGEPTKPFVYRNRGSLATIGRRAAVADLGPHVRFGGRMAWLFWGLIHVYSIVGFRARTRVMLSWGWEYLTRRGGAQVILGIDPPENAT